MSHLGWIQQALWQQQDSEPAGVILGVPLWEMTVFNLPGPGGLEDREGGGNQSASLSFSLATGRRPSSPGGARIGGKRTSASATSPQLASAPRPPRHGLDPESLLAVSRPARARSGPSSPSRPSPSFPRQSVHPSVGYPRGSGGGLAGSIGAGAPTPLLLPLLRAPTRRDPRPAPRDAPTDVLSPRPYDPPGGWTRRPLLRGGYMLGKGGKRKFDEHEDGLEGKIVSPSDGPSRVSYTLQRQTIFNISLMKLYNHRPLTEPSLQKTVLINNMLRRIQEELKQEGSLRPTFTPSSQPSDSLSDSYQEAPPPAHPCDLGSTTPLEACLTPASLLEDDDDTFCTLQAVHPAAPTRLSSPALPAEKDSFSSALDEIEELCPTSTSTEAADAAAPEGSKGTSSESSVQKPEGPQEGRTDDSRLMDSLPGNFEITTSTGFLTDLTLDDILFADIDTSMYDFDPCTSASGTASKMAPVSADDLLKTLAPYSNQPVAPSQPFKMDLTELDHIMEVLVGS